MTDTHKDLTAAALLASLGVGLWWITESFPDLPEGYPGPALFPRIIGVALVAAAVALGATGLRLKRRTARGEGTAWGPLVLIVAVVGSFPVLAPYVGVAPAVCLICLFGALLLRVPWRTALLVAIGVTAVLYGLFTVLLGIPLA